jgi:hypothetical protein
MFLGFQAWCGRLKVRHIVVYERADTLSLKVKYSGIESVGNV